MGEHPTTDAPHPGKRRPPPRGALVLPPQRAKPARNSTRCGVGDGSPRPHPPHSQAVVSGPWPQAPRTGGRAWVSAQPRSLHIQTRNAPLRGALVLARAGAVGLVTGAHAHTPLICSQWVAGPGRKPQGRAVWRWGAPNRGRPTPRQGTPPPGRPLCRPHSVQSQLAKVHAVELVTGLHAHTLRVRSQWEAGPRRTPQRRAVGRG